jgi:hypothetical protein
MKKQTETAKLRWKNGRAMENGPKNGKNKHRFEKSS